ncbi:hypothetical protein JXA48_00755 [Candidatus Woesearchaeota archaeon]|nr:hypothetical protein [Candidatus Woesearchaeota archaeon]
MKKLIAILMLISVLAIALTACASDNNVYQNDDTVNTEGASLDTLVTNDVTSNDVGNEDFVEIGDMI